MREQLRAAAASESTQDWSYPLDTGTEHTMHIDSCDDPQALR